MEELIIELATRHPGVMSVFVVIGVLRATLKPLMSLLEAYVLSTPSKKDDEKYVQWKESKVYLAIVWLVDYTSSIKLPK